MNTDILQGQWKQLKGKVQQKWGELTNDELDRIEGKREELIGLVQEKYGRSREDVEAEVNDFLANFADY
ncbi:MAG: CsbD family protein [Anaerolineales bacterium]|nr:CsbD family protein [Anaerolineales bacterium]MCB9431087.1 CsbD family protein [Ardenticatenaceae bacterium]